MEMLSDLLKAMQLCKKQRQDLKPPSYPSGESSLNPEGPWPQMQSGCSVAHDSGWHSRIGLVCGFIIFPSGGPILCLIPTSVIE